MGCGVCLCSCRAGDKKLRFLSWGDGSTAMFVPVFSHIAFNFHRTSLCSLGDRLTVILELEQRGITRELLSGH